MAIPTRKNPAIEKVINSLLPKGSLGRTASINLNVCVWCRKIIRGFKDAESRQEYTISGMCQTCQDEIFKDPESLCHQCGSDGGDEDLKVTGAGVALCSICYAQEKHEYESD